MLGLRGTLMFTSRVGGFLISAAFSFPSLKFKFLRFIFESFLLRDLFKLVFTFTGLLFLSGTGFFGDFNIDTGILVVFEPMSGSSILTGLFIRLFGVGGGFLLKVSRLSKYPPPFTWSKFPLESLEFLSTISLARFGDNEVLLGTIGLGIFDRLLGLDGADLPTVIPLTIRACFDLGE